MSEAQRTLARAREAARELRRLGRNINGYLGETIEIDAVLTDCDHAAQVHGWALQDIAVAEGFALRAYTRAKRTPAVAGIIEATQPSGENKSVRRRARVGQRPRVYLSTGIHGDEPAGPLAVRQLLQENAWPGELDLFLCPCLNPAGFRQNRRENPEGLDLNRQYLHPVARETLAHIEWLKAQPPFDLTLCLHEDWESHGFYVYELNPDQRPSLAEAMVARVAEVCPVDASELIEGRPARNGIIRPSFDLRSRPQWPEAFFLLTCKTRLSYTLEAPSDFPLSARVAALLTATKAALQTFATNLR